MIASAYVLCATTSAHSICTCQSVLTGSSSLCRFLDLPDEVKGSLPMNKENFAYILGWSDENLTGKAYLSMCNPIVSA